ncbi:MAG: PilZ domain-containing protein [Chlamydiae bacterium]|nr:PilZ domain-containing protein [Chlamydiota bacterium]MBI3276400.1 PilZ domain-containing protein [Chlamydiota bacterium]
MGFEERRKHFRRYFGEDERYFIEYKVLGKLIPKKEVALTLDLSAGGLLFRSADLIAVNSEIEFDLSLPHIKDPIHLKGRVVRVEPALKAGIYNIAVQYIEISENDRVAIDQFCTGKNPSK